LRQKGEVVPAGERDTLSVSAASGQATAMGHDSDPTHSVAIAQAQSDNSKEVEEIERQMDQLARKEDIRGSKKYMELAEPEVEKLEKFLSR
jgi:hypothetical protein